MRGGLPVSGSAPTNISGPQDKAAPLVRQGSERAPGNPGAAGFANSQKPIQSSGIYMSNAPAQSSSGAVTGTSQA